MKIFLGWIPLGFSIVMLSLLGYLMVQQDLRQSANDPQIQLAEDAASQLDHGVAPAAVVPAGQVDLRTALDPFVIIYDKSGKVVASSGTLDGSVPALPPGVLTYVTSNGEDHITWQPTSGVREAAVITSTSESHYYVLAARSLTQVEDREAHIQNIWLVGALVTLVGSFGLAWSVRYLN